MTPAEFMGVNGLFATAMEPLRQALNDQALALWKDGKQLSPWLIRNGKGGRNPHTGEIYIEHPDLSIYHHCMEVNTLAALHFYFSWQAGQLPDLPPDDDAGACHALRDQIAIVFCHDADKLADTATRSPLREQVAEAFAQIRAATWSSLTPQSCYAAVSLVEQRGAPRGLALPRLPDRLYEQAKLVGWADRLASVGSRYGAGGLIRAYNEQLPLHRHLPRQPFRLIELYDEPAILYRLRTLLLDDLYEAGHFPLIARLAGHHLAVSVPESFPLEDTLDALLALLSRSEPEYQRDPTSNHISLHGVYSAEDLIRAVDDAPPDTRLLAIQRTDWLAHPALQDYVRSWAGEASSVDMAGQIDSGKSMLYPLVTREPEASGPLRAALILLIALRGNETRREALNQRLERTNEQVSAIDANLAANLPDGVLKGLHINTRLTLSAMQLALDVQPTSESDWIRIVEQLHGGFPERPADDAGAQAIVARLKQQLGLSATSDEPMPYQAHPEGGTCLVTGTPAAEVITRHQALAGVKATAFNNRIGHQKNIRRLGDNYLSAAALKGQAVLTETLQLMDGYRSWPMTVAVPFNGLLYSGLHDEGETNAWRPFRLTGYHKDSEIENLFPWNRDLSTAFPLILDNMKPKLDETVRYLYLTARLAAHTGNPVQVFCSAQRPIKTAFYFEPMPALLKPLLANLGVPRDRGGIRRFELPVLLERLELISRILGSKPSYKFDVIRFMEGFGWAPLAWMRERLEAEGSDVFISINDIQNARRHFPMTSEGSLTRLAEAGATIQRFTGHGATRNKRLKAFNTALAQYETGLRYNRSRDEVIAAMADALEVQLDRDQLFARGEGPFRKRCARFATLFYELMQSQPAGQPVDARFIRFARSAYGHLLTETYEQLRQARTPLAQELAQEAEQLGLDLNEIASDEDED